MAKKHHFILHPLPPFRLDLTAMLLNRRSFNNIDRWDGATYRRVLPYNGSPIQLSVTQTCTENAPLLEVTVEGQGVNPSIEPFIAAFVERLLGIHVNLQPFYRYARRTAGLDKLAADFRGAKPTRYASYFETLVNAITCQLLSLTVGIHLLNRLAKAYGLPMQTDAGEQYAFPRPQDLILADLDHLRELGYSYQKGRYVVNLARLLLDGQLDLDGIENLSDEAAVKELCSIKGVGRWTAEYYLLRGLGRTHIFPGDDVGARNNLQNWLGLPDRLDYAGVEKALAGMKDYGGLIYLHLLLRSRSEKETIIVTGA